MAKQVLFSKNLDSLHLKFMIFSGKNTSLRQIPIVAHPCSLWFYWLTIRAILTLCFFSPLKKILFVRLSKKVSLPIIYCIHSPLRTFKEHIKKFLHVLHFVQCY